MNLWEILLRNVSGPSGGWRFHQRTPRGWRQLIRLRAMEDRHNPKAGIGHKYQPWLVSVNSLEGRQ